MKTNLLTRKELADFFKVTDETISNWQMQGLVHPFCMINGRPRYHLQNTINTITNPKTIKDGNEL